MNPHSDIPTTDRSPGADREQRRFQVSSNRGAARHRVRYLETGGAAVDTGECTFCQVTPELDGQASGCQVVAVAPEIMDTPPD